MTARRPNLDPSRYSVRELRERLLDGDAPADPALLRRLDRDPRAGARAIAAALEKRLHAERTVRARVRRLRERERVLWSAGLVRVAGVDEVGVGPLAGPVVAAAVVFSPDTEALPVDDSKRLAPAVRERLDASIRAVASGVGIGVADVREIDALNVYQAALLAMRRAVDALPIPPQYILADARHVPGVPMPQEAIVGGDARCHAIAAASIVAKTYRDRLMADLERLYPEYTFGCHKGYGTQEHVRELREHGPCPEHRRSYSCLDDFAGGCSGLFYDLRRRLKACTAPEELDEVKAMLAGAPLEEGELQRLRTLARRRRQGVTAGRGSA